MLINAIRAENLKSRHSHMWVAVLILPLLTAAIGAIIYGINASGQFVRRRSMAAALASNRAVLWVFFLSNPDCHLCVPICGGWNTQITTGTAL